MIDIEDEMRELGQKWNVFNDIYMHEGQESFASPGTATTVAKKETNPTDTGAPEPQQPHWERRGSAPPTDGSLHVETIDVAAVEKPCAATEATQAEKKAPSSRKF